MKNFFFALILQQFILNFLNAAEPIIDVSTLNSPVKESSARFLIKVPKDMEVKKIFFKVKNAAQLIKKDNGFKDVEFLNIPEGKEIKISVSKLPPGFYEIYVKIKDSQNREHNYKGFKKDHVSFIISDSLEVKRPDPKVNNSTLLGIDSDNDGIRDDMQRWINEKFNNQENLRLAFRQFAINFQNTLATKDNKEINIQASHLMLKGRMCIHEMTNNVDVSKLLKEFQIMFLNTPDRIRANYTVNENFHGQYVQLLSKEEACNF